MQLGSLIRKNFSFLVVSSISRFVANSLLFIIVGRYYGAEIFGSFTSSYILSLLFLNLADFGFDYLITSEIAKHNNQIIQIISRFLPIKIGLTLLAVLIYIIVGVLIPSSALTKIILVIFTLNIVFGTFASQAFSVFKGLERFDIEAKVSFGTNMVLLLTTIIISYLGLNIIYIAVAVVLLRLIYLVLLYIQLNHLTALRTLKINLRPGNLFQDFKLVSLFGLDLLFGTLYFQIDTILLLAFLGETQAGIYQSVFRLSITIFMIPDLIISTLFPTVIRIYHEGKDIWEHIVKITFRYMFYLSIPIFVLVYSFSEDILMFLYGGKNFFSNPELLALSVNVLKVSSVIFIVRYSAAPIAMILTIVGKQSIRTKIVVVVSILNISLNCVLIPGYGVTGAIVTSCISNILALGAYLYYSRSTKWVAKTTIVFPLLLSVVFIFGFTSLRSNPPVSVFLFIIMCVVFVLYGIFGLVDGSERKMIVQIVGMSDE